MDTIKADQIASLFPGRSIVLVGMMGAGKSAVGRRLAAQLGLPFQDSDAEIETAAGMSISQFFERYGEKDFREGERRVIARLLEGSPCVLSTGGGAFMDEETRALIRDRAVSVWLKAEVGVLLERAMRRDERPLLKVSDPHAKMQELLSQREQTYAQADIAVDSDNRPIDDTVDRVLQALLTCKKTVPA